MRRTVVLLATLDTKGEEAAYLRKEIEAFGDEVTIIDLGVVGSPQIDADVSREQVAAAGGTSLTMSRQLMADCANSAGSGCASSSNVTYSQASGVARTLRRSALFGP